MKYGRRLSFFTFLAMQCLFGVVTAIAPDIVHFIVLRFFVGITSSAVVASPIALAQELVGPKYRTQVSILSHSARSFGLIFLSIMAFLVRDWSHIALVTTLPFLAFFLFWWVFPESPVWLRDQGRYEEVERIFDVIAQANGRELTPEYIINLKRRFRIEGSMLKERRRSGRERRYTIWDLFRGSNTSRKTTAIIFIWFTSTTASVGLSLYSLELEGDIYVNFFMSAGAEVAAAAVIVVAVGHCGRRCSFCLSSALGGALTLSIATTQTGTTSRLTMFVVAKLSISSSSVVLPLWTGELLPAVVRSLGIQLVDMVGLIGPIALPFILHQGRKSPGVPLITLGSLQLLGALVSLLLPETIHQKTLLTLKDGEEFGKHRTWADCFRLGPPRQEAKNGILKNRGPQPQSPILSLLRRQDSLRRASSEGDQDHSDPQSESSTEQGSIIETVKITVV
ncbi:beta-alanine transporter-like [Uloborus diversus]|uniref:beta-alanine transporter-like n=1 Tax=Uloborus diversus TaxID=327109 RepID=UPI002408FC85|nr:beta-alanine transporter-like [Uloborus diversus]